MYHLETTGQFRSDYKTLSKSDIPKVVEALKLLEQDGTLPFIPYRTHKLKGQYDGDMEAHIKPDLLIIWFEIEGDTIKLIRIGSHSKLFGKKNH